MTKFGKIEFERRIFPRFTLELPISYRLEEDAPQKNGATTNVSRGGLMISVPDPLGLGDRLRIKLHLSRDRSPKSIELVGKVIWTSPPDPAKPHSYQAGIAFESVSAEDLELLKDFEQVWLE